MTQLMKDCMAAVKWSVTTILYGFFFGVGFGVGFLISQHLLRVLSQFGLVMVLFAMPVALCVAPTPLQAQSPTFPIVIDIDEIAEENASFLISVKFFNLLDGSLVPVDQFTSLRYRVDCECGNTVQKNFLPWTTVAVDEITNPNLMLLAPTVQKIALRRKDYGYEIHTMTVNWTWEVDDVEYVGYGKASFRVRDQQFVGVN